MSLFRKKKIRPQIRRDQALAARPVKNADLGEERLSTGVMMITYPIGMRPWAAALARRLGGNPDSVQYKKIQLDEMGTAVWDLIGEERTVRQVIQALAEKYQLHPKEAEVSVTTFLRELGKRGLIGLR